MKAEEIKPENEKGFPGPWGSNEFIYDGSILIFNRDPDMRDRDGQVPVAVVHSIPGKEGMTLDASQKQLATARIMAAGQDMLAALEQVWRVLNSKEFQNWDGLALTMCIRGEGMKTKGYQGEPFDKEAIKAAIDKAKRGFRDVAKSLKLKRDVTMKECPWLKRDYKAGEILYVYSGLTYGCIGPGGVAMSEHPDKDPFFEIPYGAFEQENRDA